MTTRTGSTSNPAPASGRIPPGRRRVIAALKVVAIVGLVGFVVFKVKFSPVPAVSHVVATGELVREVMGTGTLEARVASTIGPKIQGRLTEVIVDQGDTVQAGQLLARLDEAEWQGMVAVASAGLEAAVATVERVRADDARARAVLEQARLEHQRALDLRQANVAAESDLDTAIVGLRVAEADLKRAQAAILESEQQRLTAKETLHYHDARLADTRLLSPFDGLVVRRDSDPGDVVVPGSSVLQLISTNELWISAWVDETAMGELSGGQPARVVFRSEPGRNFAGRVARLGRQTDRETREFVVDVHVSELPGNWAIGQRAEVYVQTADKPSVLLLPKSFLAWSGGKPGVFVAVRGKARWRALALGLDGAASVEILDGLEPGERVVKTVDGARRALKDGTRIKAQ